MKKTKRKIDNPLADWTKEEEDALWYMLYQNGINGANFNRNRATITKHYCQIGEATKRKLMSLTADSLESFDPCI